MTKIGIPQSLFYYYYFPLWSTFFKEIGYEVVVSNTTNKNIATKGVQLTVDEVCFPVKIYFGHVANLISKADYIFCPRIVSIEPKAYICPKFMGLPDMIKAAFEEKVKLLTPTICLQKNQEQDHKTIFVKMANGLGIHHKIADKAWLNATTVQTDYENLLKKKLTPVDALKIISGNKEVEEVYIENAPTLAILGHGYNLYDEYLSMNIIKKLRGNEFNVISPEMVENNLIDKYSSRLRKKIFWTLGKRIMGSLYDFIENNRVEGIIYIASFGCGPDSIIGHLAENLIRKSDIPFMLITVDEHTGEAGINTRLEAFLDMLKRREAV
ncbi:MAG: hypothetical protein APF76_07610 [Desulfitibacter sp. BRH_c19]|nr:MAG: hypothetical protein APF76_07610 [Desulfitibacter sp. BRH_c19]